MMSTSLSTIKTLYEYNHWANARMLKACQALTLEQWDRSLGHSWGSVHGVLTHMFAAETIWLARWKGNSPKAMRQAAEFTTFADLQTVWMRAESETKDFLATCTEKALSEPVTYINTRGETRSMPLGQLMLHLANHGTHHRGELAAMLAVLNVPHPEDDMLLYFREKP
jgi:uncharacterized damage-inducible protein DinB